jgi:hypothetical protein
MDSWHIEKGIQKQQCSGLVKQVKQSEQSIYYPFLSQLSTQVIHLGLEHVGILLICRTIKSRGNASYIVGTLIANQCVVDS